MKFMQPRSRDKGSKIQSGLGGAFRTHARSFLVSIEISTNSCDIASKKLPKMSLTTFTLTFWLWNGSYSEKNKICNKKKTALDYTVMRAGKEKGLAELQTTNYKVRVFDWFSTWFSWFDRQLEEVPISKSQRQPRNASFSGVDCEPGSSRIYALKDC